MDVTVIDYARNFRVAPTKRLNADSDLFDALTTLLRRQFTHTGRVEIECDKAFFDALKAQADPKEGKVLERIPGGLERYALNGVPITVLEPEKSEGDV